MVLTCELRSTLFIVDKMDSYKRNQGGCALGKTSLSQDGSSWTWPNALIKHQGETQEGGLSLFALKQRPPVSQPHLGTLALLLMYVHSWNPSQLLTWPVPLTHVFIQASISISLLHISRYDKISFLYVSDITSVEQWGQLCKVSGPLINDRCAVSSRGLLTHPIFVR